MRRILRLAATILLLPIVLPLIGVCMLGDVCEGLYWWIYYLLNKIDSDYR